MNWAFLGYGKIATQFHKSLREFPNQKVYAIASRSNAIEMKKQYPNVVIYADYEELYTDSNVDIVYINTTHNFHCEQVIKCLESGKHVLCEKPIGVTYDEVKQMVDTSRKTGKYLLEGMWTQYLPAYKKVKKLIGEGLIGDIQFVRSDFSVQFPKDLERMYNPQLSGGGMFDMGVYNIALVNDLFERLPQEVQVTGGLTQTGVDAYIGAGLNYTRSQSAQIFCGMNTNTQWEAVIYGEKGWIKMIEFFRCQKFVYKIGENKPVEVEAPFRSTGFFHEIEATIDHIREGNIESNTFTHQKSLDSARLVEDIRNQLFNKKK